MHFITQSLWLRSLGWALLNNFWQMALLWLIYLVITGMNRRISARVKHNAAVILLHIGFAWFVLTILRQGLSPDNYDKPVVSLAGMMGNGAVIFVQYLKRGINGSLSYLSSAYLITLLIIFSRYIRNYFHLVHLRTVGLHKIQPELRIFASQVSRRLGIKKKIGVWLSDHVSSPLTIGFLKPLILIPIATINHLSMEQVETILLHELSHIHRNDFLTNLFVSIYGVVFFFNPFTRLFIHTIKKEREHCCDDLVIQFQYHPHTYASALLSLERSRARQNKFALPAVGKNNRLLLERIKRLTGHSVLSARHQFIMPSICLLVLIAAATLFVQPKEVPIKMAMVSPAKFASAKELTNTFFVVDKAPTNATRKSSKNNKPKHAKVHQQWIENNDQNEDILQVSNHDMDEEQPISNAMATLVPEKSEYSFQVSPTPSAPLAKGEYGYPYVPNSSFSFPAIDNDSLSEEENSNQESDETASSVIESLKQIDWKKIEKLADQGRTNISSADIRNIQNQIRKCIRKADWYKINDQVDAMLTETDEKRIRREICVQLKNLKTIQNNLEYIQNQTPRNFHIQRQDFKIENDSRNQVSRPVRKRILNIVHI